jgi:hypothetical protein
LSKILPVIPPTPGGILRCRACRVISTYYTFIKRRTDPISFRVKAEIKEAMQRLASQDRRGLSQYIERALEAHIEAKKQGKKGKR